MSVEVAGIATVGGVGGGRSHFSCLIRLGHFGKQTGYCCHPPIFGILSSAMHSSQLYQFGNAEWRLGAILTVSAEVELLDLLVEGSTSDGSASPLA
jgi:hypothetical protein